MAFTGAETVLSLGKNKVRITGITLAAGASGTITASAGAGDITLPASFPAFVLDRLDVKVQEEAAGAARGPIVTKSAGLITIKNADAVNATGGIEVRITHDHTITS